VPPASATVAAGTAWLRCRNQELEKIAPQPQGLEADTSLSARPLYVVLNPGSGHDDADETTAMIRTRFEQAGRVHDIFRVGESMTAGQAAREAVDRATRTGGIVVAAGGDGTLNAVAQATLGSGCPFGVIPQGTFNYFARAHGIPTDAAEATNALLNARIRRVLVGLVNDRLFLVNASLGLYVKTLDVREEQKQRHGRRRSVALWAALLTVLREHRPMRIRLARRNGTQELRTLTLFVGLNRLQLEQMGLDEHSGPGEQLTAVMLKPVSTARLLWMAVKGAMGRLAEDRGVETFVFSRLAVTPANPRVRRLKVATDGETGWMEAPIEFRIAPEPLFLLVPDRVPAVAGDS
jgi:diacylglycerol kinase family enzyme